MNNSRRRFRPRQKNNFRRRSNGVVHSNGHFQSNSGNNNFSRNGSMSNPFNIEKAIQKYKDMYNLDGCSLNNCKDISDAVKQHTAQTITTSLRALLVKTLKQ